MLYIILWTVYAKYFIYVVIPTVHDVVEENDDVVENVDLWCKYWGNIYKNDKINYGNETLKKTSSAHDNISVC